MVSGKFRARLATMVMLFSFVYFFVITLIPVPEQAIRIADTILGFLMGTAITTIIGYYFGASDENSRPQEPSDVKGKEG